MKIFYHTTASENLLHLASLAQCLGIGSELLDCRNYVSLSQALLENSPEGTTGVVLDVATLQKNCAPADLAAVMGRIAGTQTAVLLLATAADAGAGNWLKEWAPGSVAGCESLVQANVVNFPREGGRFGAELAGFAYGRKSGPALGLMPGTANAAEVIMRLDQAATFMRCPLKQANIFIWSTLRVFDVLRPLDAEIEFESAVDEYVPAMIFLRFAFGDQCWRNPGSGAGIVIDDPLLEKRYGFIDFPRLLESARKHRYHVTLAFIPWNQSRSDPEKVRMFLQYTDCFSICVHGCDHTKREFDSADYDDLMTRNQVARRRMETHRQRTDMACEPLMVCPQEQYSLTALRAFADSRQFLGVICTACLPRHLSAPALCGADLLSPAQDSFFGFPVFKRHYWTDLSVFAMSLFLGKPAILVEHHEFFRSGPGGTETFAAGLARLRPDLKWRSLADTVTATHWRRQLTENRWEVRFFTDRFRLDHQTDMTTEYRLRKKIPAMTPIRRVTVDGREIPFKREDGWVVFELHAGKPQQFEIEIEAVPVEPKQAYSPGIKYQASVAFRRRLSEFRDNVISRNDTILRVAKLLAKKLKQTST